ncbi:MAG: tetratricopeptide repeat protein [Acidobacteriaceae bacterium]|nr:tetratricopeptide repeat protein [Acidobacteriaceae bacterium]MBV9307621.1 tetratricopeptide repeat protein [Acidobacteriaceae bacterium]
MAVLPTEILIGDPSTEWMRLALPLVLQEDLATSRDTAPFFASDGSGAYEGRATEMLRTVLENRSGRLQLAATITDAQTQKNERVMDAGADSGADVIVVANRLAKGIDPRASDFPTKNLQALKSFTLGAATQDLSQRLRLLNEAVGADNNFGLAQIALIETAAQVAPQDLPALVAAGTAHHDQFAPLERARWNTLVARYSHAPLPRQADAAAAVLKIAPNNVEALGTLGVSRFLQGNSAEGERFLRQAIALSPANANLQLQLANGFIESKKFNDAITVLKPLSNSAAAVPALATANLLQGNTKEASTIFQNLIGLLPADSPPANFLRSQWEAISARSAQPLHMPATPLTPGYSAFLGGRFEEAAQFWRKVIQQTGDTDLRARAMLAASLNGMGRTADASGILVMPFVPDFSDGDVAIAFNQMRQILRL